MGGGRYPLSTRTPARSPTRNPALSSGRQRRGAGVSARGVFLLGLFSYLSGLWRRVRATAFTVPLAVVFAVAMGLEASREAYAMGESEAFVPRVLLTGQHQTPASLHRALSTWTTELTRRTSVIARFVPSNVRADSAQLLDQPFAIWSASEELAPLTYREVQGLQTFFALGGVLLVNEQNPRQGSFLASAKRELQRVLPNAKPVAVDPDHVVYRSFYLLDNHAKSGARQMSLEAIEQAGLIQVIFSPHNLIETIAPSANEDAATSARWRLLSSVTDAKHELAVRLAVNITMLVLCTDYKNDQVHAPVLMRRRKRNQ